MSKLRTDKVFPPSRRLALGRWPFKLHPYFLVKIGPIVREKSCRILVDQLFFHCWGGGIGQKETFDDEGGSRPPLKKMTSFVNSPLNDLKH